MGFIKSTDHQPTDHRPTDPVIIFKRLGNRKILILQNTHTAEKIIWFYNNNYVLHLMNNVIVFITLKSAK